MTQNDVNQDGVNQNDVTGLRRIAFQGIAGAYSDLACRQLCPGEKHIGCMTFEDVFEAIEQGQAEAGLIPVENSIAGRVAEIHSLLSHTKCCIIAEHYHKVQHQLMAVAGATESQLVEVHSHTQALAQCRRTIRSLGLQPVALRDTAEAARQIAKQADPTRAAIASPLAAQLHGLEILRRDIADTKNNVTRFFLLSRNRVDPPAPASSVMTTLTFDTGNEHGALHRALGVFAQGGINLTRLEGFIADVSFEQARFYADVEGHRLKEPLPTALENLSKVGCTWRILGSYPAHPYRRLGMKALEGQKA